METNELLRNITNLPVISGSLAEEMLSGNFRSVFKGQGMEFSEVRHYTDGDDVRTIDWNASARFGDPYVKLYIEERELTILLLIDNSMSMHRDDNIRKGYDPYEQALICLALIAFSTEHTGQRAGAFFFDNDIERVFYPQKGKHHIMSLIMTALDYQKKIKKPKSKNSSNIASALKGAQKFLKRRSFVIIISDFYSIGWEQELGNLCRKHDCLALRICDPISFPFNGLLTIEDQETGIRLDAPTGKESFRREWAMWQKERSSYLASQCRRCGSSFLELTTEDDASSSLIEFFSRFNSGSTESRIKFQKRS